MPKINKQQLSELISRSKPLQRKVEKITRKQFEVAKSQLIEDFQDHPITQEIEAGPDIDNNPSGTLGGRSGNLFAFIGFERGSKPIDVVVQILKQGITFQRKSVSRQGSFLYYQYIIRIPRAALENATPLPWENGRSWLFAIERGISGLGQYIFAKFKGGRSGSAFQNPNAKIGGAFRPQKYFSEIVNSFKKKLGA